MSQRHHGRLAGVIQRVLPIGLLAIALIQAPLMIFSQQGVPRLEAVERELEGVEGDNLRLHREIASLRARVAELRDNPAALERLAREELGLIRQNEVIFQFPIGN